VTGASSGIGEQFAYALARGNNDLVLTARREDRLNAVAATAKNLGARRVEIIAIDLARRDAPEEICRRLAAAQIDVDCLINNAGFGTAGRFDRMALARECEEIDLNIVALVKLTRMLLPAMVARHRGTIINVASTAAFQAVPFMTTYAATKAFVLSFSEGLSAELAGSGVEVLALCPGPVKTEFQAVAQNQKARVPAFAYIDAATVAAQGLAAAARGRTVYINGAINSVTAYLVRIMPRALIRYFARRIYRPVADS
jgi:hypothetical protein